MFSLREACQDFECPVESHLQITLLVLGQCPQQTLLEDGSHEGIGNDHETVGSVCQRLHFEQTDLIQTTGVNIDGVSVLRGPLR